MPTFMMLSILGPDGFATVRDDPARIRAVNDEVEAMGARVLHQYALLGQWDFMTVIEAPDDRTMIRITSALAARGTLKTHTLGAIPIGDYIDALGDGVGGADVRRAPGPGLKLDFDE
ncbi:MAG: GYD domain-containing protein [Acidimicrobiales bacterium]